MQGQIRGLSILRDTGEGIAEQDTAKIFNARASAAAT